jgi:hypothetical protein
MVSNTSPAQATLKNYFLFLSIITVVLMVVYYFFKDQLPANADFIIPAFYIITSGSHFLLQRALTREPKKFYNYFLAAMAFKMLAYLLFLAVMFLGFQGISLTFVAVFFSCYLVYTTFELLMLRPLMKKN